MQPLDQHAILRPATEPPALIELRGPSGRLYGMLDQQRLVIEVKRKNEQPETIDLKPYLEAAKHGQ